MYRLVTEEPLRGIRESERRQVKVGNISSSEYVYEFNSPMTIKAVAELNPNVKAQVSYVVSA